MTHDPFDVPLSELRRRRSYKWRAFPPDVIPAFVAEMDYAPAPVIVAALRDAVERGDLGYAWRDADLAEALCGFLGRRFDWDADPEGVVLLPDVMTGVTEVLRLALGRGDGVVINTPVYPPFFEHIEEAGCRVIEAPLAAEGGGHAFDLEALAGAFAGGARAYLLCNPHNPTGIVLSRPELEAVVELAQRYDVLILSDEIHAPLVLPGARHLPILGLGKAAGARVLAFVSASKAFNIPGLKCAHVLAASPSMRALVGQLPESIAFRAGNLGMIAAAAAYRDGAEWLDGAVAAVDANRRRLSALLAERLPAAGYTPPAAGYLAWIDCRDLGLAGEPVDVFLERGRLALGPGPDFGEVGRGHVRITLATGPPILDEIVSRMAAAAANPPCAASAAG